MPHDRSRDQMRKQQMNRLNSATCNAAPCPATIDEIGHELERVEADADRQHEPSLGNGRPLTPTIVAPKSRYLKKAEHREIGAMPSTTRPATQAADKLPPSAR